MSYTYGIGYTQTVDNGQVDEAIKQHLTEYNEVFIRRPNYALVTERKHKLQ